MTWDWSAADLSALEAFLRERDLCAGPLTTQRIGDGHSNLTFLVTDGTRRVVVRRPPPPPIPPRAHDVLREARFLRALAASAVPVPAVLATAEAGEVVDAPCYVMSHVDGAVITGETPAALAARRHTIGHSLVDTLAALHAADRRPLADLGRPDGFNARHLRSIRRLLTGGTDAVPPPFAPVAGWLERHVPPESGAAIVHNDYRLGNVIIGPDGRVAAVLDWELAAIGDPLFDVGYFLATWPAAGEPSTPVTELGAALLEPGYPTRDELAARYADATGRGLPNLTWYTALAQWKLAVLYEYNRRRAADPYYADPALVRSFLDAAGRVIDLGEP